MKRSYLYVLAALVMLASFFTASAVAYSSIQRVVVDNEKETTINLATQIYDDMNEALSAPITVARTMSSDLYLKDALKDKDFPGAAAEEQMITTYLGEICEEMGCETSFIVSDLNKRYYTPNGLNKVVDPKNDEHDVWYSAFLDGGRMYDFDVGTDEVHQNQWTVFVNARVMNGNDLLGVCGVGVKMDALQERLKHYEKAYGIDVSLVTEEGLVQVDTDSVNIETRVLEDAVAEFDRSQEYSYHRTETGGYLVTRYVPAFDWYLVVSKETQGASVYINLFQNLLVALLAIFTIAMIAVTLIVRRDRRKLERRANVDALTGVLNREAFFNAVAKSREVLKGKPTALVFLDLDHFKEVNDSLGHAVGDQAITDASHVLTDKLRGNDLVGRFGGDEFMLFIRDIPEDILRVRLNEIADGLRRTYAKDGVEVPVSTSMGVIYGSALNELPTEELLAMADDELYKAKEAGRDQYRLVNLDEREQQ